MNVIFISNIWFNNIFSYREELLYYYLIDVLRSPEVVKALTGSCVEAIKEKE